MKKKILLAKKKDQKKQIKPPQMETLFHRKDKALLPITQNLKKSKSPNSNIPWGVNQMKLKEFYCSLILKAKKKKCVTPKTSL